MSVFEKWKITKEQIEKLKRFDVETLNTVYFDNLQFIKNISFILGRKMRLYIHFEDFVQESYLLLPLCEFENDKTLTNSLCRLLRRRVVGRVCLSLDAPIKKGEKVIKNVKTFVDSYAVDGFKGTIYSDFENVDSEEHLQKALKIISQQKTLTLEQKDILTAIAFNVPYYKGIYEQEKKFSFDI